nr:hypothetical protein [uncultured Desulfobulbus sp.]
MISINNAYINALLADSSYVQEPLSGKTGIDLADDLSERMGPNIAQFIGDNFTVLTLEASADSSFNTTVWRVNPGADYEDKIYVSMRGTQELKDFTADADLATSGLAKAQITDMVNWWMRETNPLGEFSRSP